MTEIDASCLLLTALLLRACFNQSFAELHDSSSLAAFGVYLLRLRGGGGGGHGFGVKTSGRLYLATTLRRLVHLE